MTTPNGAAAQELRGSSPPGPCKAALLEATGDRDCGGTGGFKAEGGADGVRKRTQSSSSGTLRGCCGGKVRGSGEAVGGGMGSSGTRRVVVTPPAREVDDAVRFCQCGNDVH